MKDKLNHKFSEKQKKLLYAKNWLKQEFFGLDSIIDELADNVSSWYLLPELQDRPVVINLWGLTGVGKTSLVHRMVKLLEFEDHYYRFDLGEKKGSFSFRDSLDELCQNNDESPLIIGLDEFQHSRTKLGNGEEIETDENRMIWELLDSGKVSYLDWKPGIWSFEELIRKLYSLSKAGVEVKKGQVISGKALFLSEMDVTEEEGKPILFVPINYYESILEFAGDKLGLSLLRDVEQVLKGFNAEETMRFLIHVITYAKRPSVKNFSKSLIIVMGNLDEAYQMSDNLSTDIDADQFHERSLKINIPQIKQSLQKRFRNEQIARLGNAHIIYPALNRSSYEKIIQNQLDDLTRTLLSKHEINISFGKSINRLIYTEGVYPTQGVRPIFTTIHQLVKSNLSAFIVEMMLQEDCVDSIHIEVDRNHLKGIYYLDGRIVFDKSITIKMSLEDLRKNKKDDLQAITAVHEAGHAILMVILLKVMPEVIYSVTADSDSQGFTYLNIPWKYIAKNEIIPRVAMLLGGYVAESLVFGDDKVTNGASSDIKRATEMVSQLYKENGMAGIPLAYSIAEMQDNNLFHDGKTIEEQVKNTIEKGMQLANSTLHQEKKLLLMLSDYLSDNTVIKKQALENMINTCAFEKDIVLKNGNRLFYRDCLKKQLANLTQEKHEVSGNLTSVCVNKNS